MFLYGCIAMLIGIGGFAMTIGDWSDDVRIRRGGIQINATVGAKRVAESSRSGSAYRIITHYKPPRLTTYTAEFGVPRDQFETFKPGDSVRVVYLPGDPGKSRLESATRDSLWRRDFLLFVLALIPFGAGAASVWRSVRVAFRASALARTGIAVQGTVNEVRVKKLVKGGGITRLSYNYFGPDGMAYESTSPPVRRRKAELLKAGDNFRVFCDPANPRQHWPDFWNWK